MVFEKCIRLNYDSLKVVPFKYFSVKIGELKSTCSPIYEHLRSPLGIEISVDKFNSLVMYSMSRFKRFPA